MACAKDGGWKGYGEICIHLLDWFTNHPNLGEGQTVFAAVRQLFRQAQEERGFVGLCLAGGACLSDYRVILPRANPALTLRRAPADL